MHSELERIKSKPFAVPGLGRVASALNLVLPTKLKDPTYYDSTILGLHSAGIVGRDKVWEIAVKLLAAANINEAEVELLPKAPLAKGYRLSQGPTAGTQAEYLVESLPFGKGTEATWKEVFVTFPGGESTEKLFVGLVRSRMETAKSRKVTLSTYRYAQP